MSGHAKSVTKADRVCGPVSSHGTPRDQGAAARKLASTARVESGPETVEKPPPGSRSKARVRPRREASRATGLAQACARARKVPPTT